ncbi:bifunctional folylpolyglutamate synthase/dihydrofolate synthase [Sporolactobacillus sp. CPB3-1]|uniref:tetrahydrofolate synthase n=1 Tax=Sporolactobacillus mangiferae TaxID=2940498 RepID=A0ABT0M788_9BACL|nr:folylpolyglutamate synthase/dihydrofolate synthase family protein [Sporolactobacillus mangiferae]MCL1630518.1 bifunctional folylpolyglutamate synthase/dihydrofolate synthase [Sporolactobacillus mangiferae]
MFRSIEETMDWIHQLNKFGIRPGLERMEWVLREIGNPERKLHAIHVGGTNGKGSTVCLLRYIYQESGLQVGTYISPYITSFNERIMVNGEPISNGDLIKAANIVYPLAQRVNRETDFGNLTEFEVVTLISFVYFGMIRPCNLVIYEVGLGGRLDSTNVIQPLVSVITNVAMDHMNLLGDTIKEIAFEKSGIIKQGIGVVTTAEHPDARAVIRRSAAEKNAKLFVIDEDFTTRPLGYDEAGEHFDFDTKTIHYRNLTIHLRGTHQLNNASAALMAVNYLATYCGITVQEDAIRSALKKAAWPGRFEKIMDHPLVIIDGAHNVQGTEALVQAIQRYYAKKTIHLLYAALEDKEYKKMIRCIETIASDMTLTTFDFPRAASSDVLFSVSLHPRKRKIANWKTALRQLLAQTTDQDLLLICGSLYFISRVRVELNRYMHD